LGTELHKQLIAEQRSIQKAGYHNGFSVFSQSEKSTG